jgi:hypothetical protein
MLPAYLYTVAIYFAKTSCVAIHAASLLVRLSRRPVSPRDSPEGCSVAICQEGQLLTASFLAATFFMATMKIRLLMLLSSLGVLLLIYHLQ